MKGVERDGANMGIGETSWLIGGEHNGLAKRFPLTWLQVLMRYAVRTVTSKKTWREA